MVHTIDELKQKIASIAKKYNISTMYIFGSYARGEAVRIIPICCPDSPETSVQMLPKNADGYYSLK